MTMGSWQAWTAPVAFLSPLMLAGCKRPDHVIERRMLSAPLAVLALTYAAQDKGMNGHVELPTHACMLPPGKILPDAMQMHIS